jgi:hypothetical protein
MNAHLSQLMDKEVSRKEFLAMLGLALASVFGFSTILKLLTGKSLESHQSLANGGYGSSLYGGMKETQH